MLVINMLSFISDDPCSNPAEIYYFHFIEVVWKQQKEAGNGPLKNKHATKNISRFKVFCKMLNLVIVICQTAQLPNHFISEVVVFILEFRDSFLHDSLHLLKVILTALEIGKF